MSLNSAQEYQDIPDSDPNALAEIFDSIRAEIRARLSALEDDPSAPLPPRELLKTLYDQLQRSLVVQTEDAYKLWLSQFRDFTQESPFGGGTREVFFSRSLRIALTREEDPETMELLAQIYWHIHYDHKFLLALMFYTHNQISEADFRQALSERASEYTSPQSLKFAALLKSFKDIQIDPIKVLNDLAAYINADEPDWLDIATKLSSTEHLEEIKSALRWFLRRNSHQLLKAINSLLFTAEMLAKKELVYECIKGVLSELVELISEMEAADIVLLLQGKQLDSNEKQLLHSILTSIKGNFRLIYDRDVTVAQTIENLLDRISKLPPGTGSGATGAMSTMVNVVRDIITRRPATTDPKLQTSDLIQVLHAS